MDNKRAEELGQTRRGFLKAAVAGVVLGGGWSVGAMAGVGARAARRPNVVFIITDDQRADAVGLEQELLGAEGRFGFLKTPHMDRIAREGARCENAFVVHSLCSPSRAAFLTGNPTRVHGIRDNKTAFEPRRTWAHALGEAGYATVYVGKWHMGKQRERPGFGEVYTFLDQGVYRDCGFVENGRDVESRGWVDDVVGDRAAAYIRRAGDRPFGMVVGFKSPHDPRQPAERHRELFAGQEIRPPASVEDVPTFRQAVNRRPWNPTAADRLNYFRCLTGVDENVGKILAALDETGLANDTVVIYTSDNGYYLGEHGLGDKRTAYEESLRIPFLVRYPRKVAAGTVVREMVLNMDLAPTLLSWAGVEGDWEMMGRDASGVLAGVAEEGWRKSFLYESYQDPEYAAVTFDVKAVRTERGKLVTYPGRPEWTQVFDLLADPTEVNNLAGTGTEVERELRAEMARLGG